MGHKKTNFDWHGREWLPWAIWWLMLLLYPDGAES